VSDVSVVWRKEALADCFFGSSLVEGQKHATGAHSDAKLSATMQKMKKPSDRIRECSFEPRSSSTALTETRLALSLLCFPESLAQIIIYSMSNDAPLLPESGFATPSVGGPSAMAGIETSSAQLGGVPVAHKKYLAGSKALDALAKLITNCESMFHPSVSLVTSSQFGESRFLLYRDEIFR